MVNVYVKVYGCGQAGEAMNLKPLKGFGYGFSYRRKEPESMASTRAPTP